jgi:hypothetical protein
MSVDGEEIAQDANAALGRTHAQRNRTRRFAALADCAEDIERDGRLQRGGFLESEELVEEQVR